MADLLIVVPSRGRPSNVARLLRAWAETGAWGTADLRIDIDADDPRHDDYLALELPPGAKIAVGHRWRPLVWKMNRAARQEADQYCALGFMGDDHLPRTAGWADRYLDALHDLRTGIVYPNDGHHGAQLPTSWAMTSDIVRVLGGKLTPAPVDHLYCDNAVLDLGQTAGCIRYLPDVYVDHLHYTNGRAPVDDQYRRVNSRTQYARDQPAYRRWRTGGGLARDAATIRALRRTPPVPDAPAAPALVRSGPKIVATYARRDEPQSLVDDLARNLSWVDDLIELQVPQDGPWTHEGQRLARQRDMIREAHGDGVWTLWIDPDERLEDQAGDLLRKLLADSPTGMIYGLTLREMWTPTAYRVDGEWGRKKPRWRIFHLHAGQTFTVDRPIHCLPTPRGGRRTPVDINLYHLKMIEPANRAARAEAFLAADPSGRYQPGAGDWSHLTDETGMQLEEIPPGRGYSPLYVPGSYLFTPPR